MDNAVAPHVQYHPDRRYTVLAAGGAAFALVAALLAGVGPGGLFALVTAVVLGCYAVGDVVFSPRLVADAGGVRIRTPVTRAALDWAQIEHVRVDERLRWGVRNTALEVDAGAVLVVLSRRAIGADPEHAAGAINAFRPGGTSLR